MITVHQALFGDRHGAYSLLSSSCESQEVPRRLAPLTDLVDRPSNGVLTGAVTRGFFADGYYLLIKSFPDHSPNVRRGRVFSHALIVDEDAFYNIYDITRLMNYHLSKPDKKTASLQPIQVETNSYSEVNASITKRTACAINALIKHTEFGNTIAWINTEGYFEWISCIWPALPNPVKLKIRIGVAFNPQKIKANSLNLVYIPQNIKQNWTNYSFKLIEPLCESVLTSQVANLLSGNIEQASNLHSMLQDFIPEIKDIGDLICV